MVVIAYLKFVQQLLYHFNQLTVSKYLKGYSELLSDVPQLVNQLKYAKSTTCLGSKYVYFGYLRKLNIYKELIIISLLLNTHLHIREL